MKTLLSLSLLLISSTLFAAVPKGCPSTRTCVENKNCTFYAFKHNCHGVCQSQIIQNVAGQETTCPLQCACLKKPKTENA